MTSARRTGFAAPLSVGEFRALWAAEAQSVVGDQLAKVALSVVVYTRTGSAGLAALSYAALLLPALVSGPLYLAANPLATPTQVRNALVAKATTGVMTNPGTGLPNLVLYSGDAPQPMPPPPPPTPTEPAPTITTMACDAVGGHYDCSADWTGGTPPLTVRWSPAQSGGCAVGRFATVSLTVIDAIGRTATMPSRFYCWNYE